jgi:hypothetical protein
MDAGRGRVTMTYHKFKVGQTVNVIPNRLDKHLPGGAYVVVRLLPIEGVDVRYRVKNAHDGHERVVHEDQLSVQERMVS